MEFIHLIYGINIEKNGCKKHTGEGTDHCQNMQTLYVYSNLLKQFGLGLNYSSLFCLSIFLCVF